MFLFAVSIVVGIPHVKRDTNYLFTTLNSLFSALSKEEKDDSLFIVFVGEVGEIVVLLENAIMSYNYVYLKLNCWKCKSGLFLVLGYR